MTLSVKGPVGGRLARVRYYPGMIWPLRVAGSLALASAASLGGCAGFSPAVPETSILAERRAELLETHRVASLRAAGGDLIGALSGVFDARGFFSGAASEPGRGPAAAAAYLRRDTLNATSRALWTVLRSDVSAVGRDGYTYGYLDVIRSNGDTVPGAFHAYWRRGVNGAWKVLAMARQRRQSGPTDPLPAAIAELPRSYRVWPAADSLAAFSTLKATEVAFSDSAASNVRAAFMAFAAPDAAKLGGTKYGFGPDAIGEPFKNPPAFFTGIKWYAEFGTVAESNDLGFDVGPVVRRAPAPGGAEERVGTFFTIWRRQPDGQWRYLVD
jgi:ketosteroid isomerase-like protein